MSFTEFGGANELFWLARKANPTVPATLNQSTCYFPKLVTAEELATVTMAGKYGSGVRGYVELDYTRLDLAKLFKNGPMKIGVREAKPLLALLDDVYESTGYRFDVTDLVPVLPPEGQTLPWRITLKAAKTSFIYYGEVEVEFVQRKAFMGEVVLTRELDPVLAGFTSTVARERAEFATFGVDYTAANDLLGIVSLGLLDLTKAAVLKDVLNSVDHLPWTSNAAPAPWNLRGATVRYNGKVSDYDATWQSSNDIRRPNSRYDRVLVVDFNTDATGATGFYGSAMFVHYNSPLDNEVLDGNS